MTNDGIAALNQFKIDGIHYSMFDVGRSMFDVQFFSVTKLLTISIPNPGAN